MPTHEVKNQVPPLHDYNLYTSDRALRDAVTREGGQWGADSLTEFGQLVGSADMQEHGRLANENPPILKAFDRFGHRVNVVEYHPSYHHLMSTSMAHGLHSMPWRVEKDGRLVVRAAKNYMMSQVEAGHGCPITMTFASIPALRHDAGIAAEWIPRLTSNHYDSSNRPAALKSANTAGMAMTEKQGGSDVRANATRAIRQADGSYRLVGHKWFCSAPMSDLFLTLAYDDDGLSCFIVPRWMPDDKPNSMNLQRLKDKVGNRSNASSEIEYDQAYALRLGAPGRGVRTIIDMVAHTRLDCVVASAGLMRQAVAQASHHARHRYAFGKALIDQPLMRNVLADIAIEAEAATALGFKLARAYELGSTDPVQAQFARIATAIGKYWVCKRVPWVAYEAMESHGGNGYITEHSIGRLYKEAPLNSIWEGSGNVICLDVLRALVKEPDAFSALRHQLDRARGAHAHYDQLLNRIDSLAQGAIGQSDARRFVEMLALALQGSILITTGDDAIADAFVQSRLSPDRFACFGTLAQDIDIDAVLRRASPQNA
ncbi:MAG: acyl-CoA dehydrogenase family protein [Myxococcota bacterium]|nr:acyl-CoA dehydrogenase family protein [Myxococcota bacterium]